MSSILITLLTRWLLCNNKTVTNRTNMKNDMQRAATINATQRNKTPEWSVVNTTPWEGRGLLDFTGTKPSPLAQMLKTKTAGAVHNSRVGAQSLVHSVIWVLAVRCSLSLGPAVVIADLRFSFFLWCLFCLFISFYHTLSRPLCVRHIRAK